LYPNKKLKTEKMILIDQRPLESDALHEDKHKLHEFAKEYDSTLKELHGKYKDGIIRFKRIGWPKYTKGADSSFREVPNMLEPTPPMRIPLKAYAVTGSLGKHLWMCCLDAPVLLPNGLSDMGRKKTLSIIEEVIVNINEQPDLAFFLYKISPFVRRKLLQVIDPVADDAKIGEEKRTEAERKSAIWHQLSDEKLLMMARGYGVTDVDNKQPNAIRQELEALLETNDKLQKQNPIIKGTNEFIKEMKVTDGLLLRNFVQKAMDDNKLDCKGDGRWKIGEKGIIQVPFNELDRKKDYLCNYLMLGNNTEKLQEFITDLINKDYLEGITENKEWLWLAKIAGVSSGFKKIDEVKGNVANFFCPI